MALTTAQIVEIEYFGERTIDGDNYVYRDYLYQSEIHKNGHLYAVIDNKKALNDTSRVTYIKRRMT